MNCEGWDCLYFAFLLALSAFVKDFDARTLTIDVLHRSELDIQGLGFKMHELKEFSDRNFRGHVHFTNITGTFSNGDLLINLGFAVAMKLLCGVYIMRSVVRYPGSDNSPHYMVLFANTKTPVIRDPLQPGDHPFRMHYLRHVLNVQCVSNIHEIRVMKTSPLLRHH
jgi:hypothetical protein